MPAAAAKRSKGPRKSRMATVETMADGIRAFVTVDPHGGRMVSFHHIHPAIFEAIPLTPGTASDPPMKMAEVDGTLLAFFRAAEEPTP